jgi:hypothetical protein
MNIKTIFLILILTLNLNAAQFNSYSIKKEKERDYDESTCRLVFLRSPGIFFKNENVTKTGYFFLNHNLQSFYKAPVYIQDLIVSTNLQDIPQNEINIVFDKTIKIKLSDFLRTYVFLKKGNHSIHLEINKERTSINIGTARLEFNLITNCKNWDDDK